MKTITHKETTAINMLPYGIEVLAVCTESKIDYYMNEYRTQPDKKFGAGRGKRLLQNEILRRIISEDIYFTRHPAAQLFENNRWNEFIEDCIIYATLTNYLDGIVIDMQKLSPHPCLYATFA
jgi:alpha-D-ribose 1-methylphosphonate 5-phosphate C-P lyase